MVQNEAFVAFDTAKARNSVAIADAGRHGEVRYLGEFENSDAATRKLVNQLSKKYDRLSFCYEAGPTGYGLFRLIQSLGHECIVAAPSLIPKKPGDRVKTNRRDAINLAKLLRASELTAVWVPDERHEAMRDLVRTRDAASRDYKAKRQHVSAYLLRIGVQYPGKKTWGRAHTNWLTSLKLEHREQRIAYEEMLLAVRQSRERVERLEQTIRDAVADWSLAPAVSALQALRGIDLVTAAAFMAELGDLSRFDNPRRLMGYLGLAPSEQSTGDSVRRGGITKAGNSRARKLLIEAAWSYRFPARVSKDMLPRNEAAPRSAREICWKAQIRLCSRFRTLTKKGKRSTVVVIAIARELAAFIWAICRETVETRAASVL
jgi:transposase